MCELIAMSEALTISALRDATGISKSYASEILNGQRKPSAGLACRIFRKTGHKIGPIAGLSADQIEAVERGLNALAAA